ncbi:MAG: inositol monophosphatase [Actinobacteria bacterium]|nr:inositol monophosphatase [Actinomycetota bacterium]
MRQADLEQLRTLAIDVAEETGRLLLDYATRIGELRVDTKTSETDPVSEADQAAERLIADRLTAGRPEDGFLGEEDAANREGTSGLRWVVDPLDGTVNFLYGIPQWCVSIACEDGDGPLVAVVHDPNVGDMFSAVRGAGATGNGKDLAVNERTLDRALVATGFSYDPAVRTEQGSLATDILGQVRDIRRAGAAALDLSWVAAGRIDGFYEFDLKPWDWMAGMLLVEEAGGLASRHKVAVAGSERTAVIAGCPDVHDRLVEIVVGRFTA